MKKFAVVVQETGEVTGTIQPATDDMISDFEACPYDTDCFFKEIDEGLWQEFNKDTYWWSGQMWRVRPSKPSKHHTSWSAQGNAWTLDVDSLLKEVRQERNKSLLNSDWTQLPDSPLTEAERQEWATYRQALRDLPSNNPNIQFLADIQWPEKPTTPRN